MDIKVNNLKWNGALAQRRSTKYIILHCTATPEGKDYSVERIHEIHLANKWAGIGYHYLISRDGVVFAGRPDNCTGAHAGADLNPCSLAICYVGGIDANGKAKDTRTLQQKEAIFQLVKYCLLKFGLKITDVRAHYEFAKKACPSFNIEQFRKDYNQWLNAAAR